MGRLADWRPEADNISCTLHSLQHCYIDSLLIIAPLLHCYIATYDYLIRAVRLSLYQTENEKPTQRALSGYHYHLVG